MSDDNLKTSSISLFVADFSLSACEFDGFTFKILYWVILYWYYIRQNQIILQYIYNTLTVPCKKSETVSLLLQE